jgi:VanZ family protein
VKNDTWRGWLRGLAIYNQELTPAQVRRHFETWTKQGRPEPLSGEQAIAIYLFDEHAGSVVHNAVRPGIDLSIPERYLLLYQRFLEPFWQEYKPGWSHFRDILVNVFGFVPLGFFFYGYWSSVRPIRNAILVTTVLGFALSLTIEVAQSFLPTRNSGTMDLITNTLGTFLGIKLHGSKTARVILEKIYRVPVRGSHR